MPLQTVWIAGVKTIYRSDLVPVYRIFARRTPTEVWSEEFTTRDALKASACERAYATGQPVTIASRETRFGWEIVTVELQPKEAA